MIKRVIFSLALLIPAVLHAAINPVPVKSTSASVSASTWPVTANLGSAPTSGNLLVIAVATNNDAVAMTATVSDGFTAGPLYLAGTAGALGCATFWKKSDGTEQTVDIEVSATTQAGQYVYAEFPGTDLNLNAIEGSGENESNIAGATTSLSSGSASNTTADAVAVAILCTDNGVDQTPSYSNSYTQRASGTTGTNAEIFIANKVVSSTASQTTTGTITSAAGYGAILVFGATGGTCPATCAGGRSARCITDISDASDPDNLLYA